MKVAASPSLQEDLDSLWLLLRNGERAGLAGLYRHFSQELFRYGLSIVHDQDSVQDCIQEVFIDLWKYHQNLPKAENVKVYLFKSLSHKVFRENKKASKWRKEEITHEDEARWSIQSAETLIIGAQQEEQLQKKLATAMGKLPDRQKEVVSYLFFENFSYEETAKIMGINLRSAYTLAWKAISSLKKGIVSLIIFVLLGGNL